MRDQSFSLEVRNQPDVLVRVVQIIQRRGWCVREIKITPGQLWAQMDITTQGINNLEQVARSLEKLVDVHRAQFTNE